jgi:hypothetical protein
MAIPLVCRFVFQNTQAASNTGHQLRENKDWPGCCCWMLFLLKFVSISFAALLWFCLQQYRVSEHMCTTFRNLTCYHYLIFRYHREKVSRYEFNATLRYFVVSMPFWDLRLSYRFLEGKSSSMSRCSVGIILLSDVQLLFCERRSRLNSRNISHYNLGAMFLLKFNR